MAACAAAAAAAAAAAGDAVLCNCRGEAARPPALWKDQEVLVPQRGSLAADIEPLASGTGLGFVEHPVAAKSAAIGLWEHEPSDCPPKANLRCREHLHEASFLKPSPCVCGPEDALRLRLRHVPQLGKHVQRRGSTGSWPDAIEEEMQPGRLSEILC